MTTMPDVAGGWLCSLLLTLGGILGREISYLAGLITPIWDVLVPQGEQEQVLNRLTMRPRSPAFQIRQVVPVGLCSGSVLLLGSLGTVLCTGAFTFK